MSYIKLEQVTCQKQSTMKTLGLQVNALVNHYGTMNRKVTQKQLLQGIVVLMRVKGLPTDAQCTGIWVTLHQLLMKLRLNFS